MKIIVYIIGIALIAYGVYKLSDKTMDKKGKTAHAVIVAAGFGVIFLGSKIKS